METVLASLGLDARIEDLDRLPARDVPHHEFPGRRRQGATAVPREAQPDRPPYRLPPATIEFAQEPSGRAVPQHHLIPGVALKQHPPVGRERDSDRPVAERVAMTIDQLLPSPRELRPRQGAPVTIDRLQAGTIGRAELCLVEPGRSVPRLRRKIHMQPPLPEDLSGPGQDGGFEKCNLPKAAAPEFPGFRRPARRRAAGAARPCTRRIQWEREHQCQPEGSRRTANPAPHPASLPEMGNIRSRLVSVCRTITR